MAERERAVRVGFIGCGRATRNLHLPALRRIGNVEVAAAADHDPEALRQTSDRYGIPRRFTDYRELLEQKDVDAVAVCLPATLHAQVAVAVLDARKHLLLEKPLALSVAECDRIVEAAARSGVQAMIAHNLRWHPLVRRARGILAREALGLVQLVRTALTKPVPWQWTEWTISPLLVEFGVHHFDLWRFLFQAEVEEVSCTWRFLDVGEVASVTARMNNGILVSGVFCDFTQNSNQLDVYGSRGRLRLSAYRWDSLKVYTVDDYPGEPRLRLRHFLAELPRLPHALLQSRRGGIFFEAYPAEWRSFLASVRSGQPVEATVEDGRRAVQIAQAATESAHLGRPVNLPVLPSN